MMREVMRVPGQAENPFSSLLLLMRSQGGKAAPPSWGIGEVAQVAPLKVVFGGVTLDASQLFLPAWLSSAQWRAGSQVALLPDADYELILVLGERVV